MNEDAMKDAFEAFEPSGAARARMEDSLLAAYAISQRSLIADWLELMRTTPATGFLLVAASTTALLLASPIDILLALARWLA